LIEKLCILQLSRVEICVAKFIPPENVASLGSYLLLQPLFSVNVLFLGKCKKQLWQPKKHVFLLNEGHNNMFKNNLT
jgi:hypothetical protein